MVNISSFYYFFAAFFIFPFEQFFELSDASKDAEKIYLISLSSIVCDNTVRIDVTSIVNKESNYRNDTDNGFSGPFRFEVGAVGGRVLFAELIIHPGRLQQRLFSKCV